MTANSISNYLKYANLQMAAEALFEQPNNSRSLIVTSKPATLLSDALRAGNSHASKFPPTLKQQFIDDGWSVVAHQPDTSTGFSGTLFSRP